MMPGQPGMTKEMCLEDFRRIFEDEKWKPDYLKIYPTLVVRDTVTYDMWRNEEFQPLRNEEAADLVAEIKDMIPGTRASSASSGTFPPTTSTRASGSRTSGSSPVSGWTNTATPASASAAARPG